MTDGIIKGTGNSRFLKSVPDILTRYPTYESFAAALRDGTLPIDLNGINELGWQVLATALNKANLLSDTTAALFGKSSEATINDVLYSLGQNFADWVKIETGRYTGTGKYGISNPNSLTFSFPAKLLIIQDVSSGSPVGIGNTSANRMSVLLGDSIRSATMTTDGNTVSWFNTSLASYQLNTSGYVYGYLAIG